MVLNVAASVAVWLVVWYLASHLGEMVRARDEELASTNERLRAAREERAQHMLRTTHELKAPFAAIHANAQLLLRGDCGRLTEDAREVVRRIADRCHRLTAEIQEMLQLANLSSPTERPHQWEDVRLDEVIKAAAARVGQTARERNVSLALELEPVTVFGVEEHMTMMFVNLLANAVLYSEPGGRVEVCCAARQDGGPVASVRDEGIGIEPEKVPRIFEPYYRTDEAARFNKNSTGLGLAIVRQVAEMHRIRVQVETAPAAGTKFTLRSWPESKDASTGAHG